MKIILIAALSVDGLKYRIIEYIKKDKFIVKKK